MFTLNFLEAKHLIPPFVVETKSLQLLAALTETLGMQANGYILQVAVILAVSCLGEHSEGLLYLSFTFDHFRLCASTIVLISRTSDNLIVS